MISVFWINQGLLSSKRATLETGKPKKYIMLEICVIVPAYAAMLLHKNAQIYASITRQGLGPKIIFNYRHV